MTHVTFKRTNPQESRIFADDTYVGDVYRHDDILNPDQHYYVLARGRLTGTGPAGAPPLPHPRGGEATHPHPLFPRGRCCR